MNANELVVVARLATHYEEKHGRSSDEALRDAEHDVRKIQCDAPQLWARLWGSDCNDREIGDRLYLFVEAHKHSGMTVKNFAIVYEGGEL